MIRYWSTIEVRFFNIAVFDDNTQVTSLISAAGIRQRRFHPVFVLESYVISRNAIKQRFDVTSNICIIGARDRR